MISRLAFFIAALLAAAPARADLSIAEVAGLTGADRQKILEEGARREGEVVWIGSFNEDNAKPILDQFAKRYPFIKVNRVRMDSVKALQRLLAEFRAKSARTDLVTTSAVVDLKRAGAVQAFKTPSLDVYPAQDKDPEGFYAPFIFYYFGLAAYNTDQVKPADAPRSYDDLLAPKWKGQIVTAAGSSGMTFWISFLRMQWGDAKATAYLEKLAQQKLITRAESARTVFGMTISGEHKLMINPFLNHVGEAQKKGAPIDVAMVDPVAYAASPVLLGKLSPHPHAAMLLLDFLLGPEAQTVLRDKGYYPAHPDIAPSPEMAPFLPKTHGFQKFLVDENEIARMAPETNALMSRLFE